MVRLLFIHTDNLFLRPSWWEALPETHKQALNQMTKSGTTMRMRTGDEMADDAISLLSVAVIEVVRG